MRHATGRLLGVGMLIGIGLAGGVLALAWLLRMDGPAESKSAPSDFVTQPVTPRLTGDAWLAAQPRASNPPAAVPAGFWRADAVPQPASATPAPRLEIVGERGRQNVVLHDASGKVHELTGFTQPQHVYDAAISADGTLAYVWHMAFSPRQVSVYDVQSRALLHRFAPGSGGDLRWAKSDPVLLLETGGMGMGGSRVTAFAPDGTTLVRTGVGAQAISPDDRWVLSKARHDDRLSVRIYRIATGERIL